LKTHAALDVPSLEQLRSISAEMLSLAEKGDWDAVLEADNSRLTILQDQKNDNIAAVSNESRQILIDEILKIDTTLKELAGKERKSVMDNEIRQQAQVAAQAGYKQALTTDTGLQK